ncbi:MAG: NAD-dependent epimerase/dehydratase family protein [Asticcacaulis sp.]
MLRPVLVTGASGGLGAAVCEALIGRGYRVRATGRKASARVEGLGCDYVSADLTDAGVLAALTEGTQGVIHCAALSSPWDLYADFYDINVRATRNLLNAARDARVRRFVFVSSPSVYGRPVDQLGLSEADPVTDHPLNAYAATKILAETEVCLAAANGLAALSVRPRALVGPEDQVLLPRVLRLLAKGRFPLWRGGQALIELTDVRDVAQALVSAFERAEALSGEVINISGGQAVPVRDMVQTLADGIGAPVQFVRLPYGLTASVARAAEVICGRLPSRPEPPVTPYSLATLAFSQTFDLSKARRVLDYKPQYDALKTAVEVARGR